MKESQMVVTNLISKSTQAIRLIILGILILGLSAEGRAESTNFNLQAALAAADKGDVKAQYDLGQRYRLGIGVLKDYHKSAEYLQKAAEQGNADAQVTLGSLYGRGHGVPRSVAMAVHWYRKAADQGHPLGEYVMGFFYAHGTGVTNDMDQAIQWWLKAAKQNQMDAQASLGQIYLVPDVKYGRQYVNYQEANHWLQLAAAQGSAGAMNNLGAAYESGLGVDQDPKEAAKWYRMGAERGNAQAQANLGQLYLDGRGVEYDPVEAYKWFKLSSQQGNTLGAVGFNGIQSHSLLTPKQLADAEEKYQDFKPIPPEKVD